MSLQRFAAAQVRKQNRHQTTPPDPARCLEVVGVAKVCPAAEAGVQAGDLLVEAGKTQAARLDPELALLVGARDVAYRFYSPARGDELAFVADGIPLGIELRLTPEAVEATYRPEGFDLGPLLTLWEIGRWDLLERLAQATLEARANPALKDALSEGGTSARDTPALILLAAALYEQGRHAEAMEHVQEYEAFGDNWTQNFMGISACLQAKQALAEGEEERGKELLELAWDLFEDERIAGAFEEAGFPRPRRERPWVGQPFPDYALLRVFGSGRVALKESLAGLAPGQLLTVCALASYRANGPYHEFVSRYCGYLRAFEGSLARLHVITMSPEPREQERTWLEAEALARKAKVPLEVLKEEGELTQELGLTSSPSIFVLTPDGVVVHQGPLTSGRALWETLEAAYARTAVFPEPAQRRFPGDPEPFRARDCLTILLPAVGLLGGGALGAYLWGWLGGVGLAVGAAFLALILGGMLNPPEDPQRSS